MQKPAFLNQECHDCGAKEGELHELGCDMERCPFCGNQLVTCGCCYDLLRLRNYGKHSADTDGLPPKVYNNGIPEKQEKQWMSMLNKKGRAPYIILPNFCRRCLTPYPDLFNVPNDEWKMLPVGLHKEMLCRECYNQIIKWVGHAKKCKE